jgi:hypothetical protein
MLKFFSATAISIAVWIIFNSLLWAFLLWVILVGVLILTATDPPTPQEKPASRKTSRKGGGASRRQHDTHDWQKEIDNEIDRTSGK